VDLGANVVLDQERCVLCTRCVRFTQKIAKTNELGVLKRADHSVITTFPGTQLSSPYAMNVVDLCPVGALTNKDFRFHKRVWFLQSQEAICNGCARGCSLFVDHHKEKYKEEVIYRYRPRLNVDVNGYFICDAGRLSYKNENVCQGVHPLIRGKISESEYAEGKLLKLLKRHQGKTVWLLSSNLSLEEMVRVEQVAKSYGGMLSAYGEQHEDVAFGDTFLKCSDRSSNGRALKLLNIDASKSSFEGALREASLVITVGRNDVELLKAKGYGGSVVIIAPRPLEVCEGAELFLPMSSHMAREGSFINTDGYVQYSPCAILLVPNVKSLLAIVAFLLNDGILTCKDVWEHLVVKHAPFSTLSFHNLPVKIDA
jgi:NADH-quinone oxidoreductase subunit G